MSLSDFDISSYTRDSRVLTICRLLRYGNVRTSVDYFCILDNPKPEQVPVRLLIEIPIRQNLHQRHLSYRQFIRQIIFVRFR